MRLRPALAAWPLPRPDERQSVQQFDRAETDEAERRHIDRRQHDAPSFCPRRSGVCETLARKPQAFIVPQMNPLLIIAVIALMVALLGVLGTGVVQMFRGSDPRRSNKLMQYRVMLQFGLVMLMGLAMLVFHR